MRDVDNLSYKILKECYDESRLINYLCNKFHITIEDIKPHINYLVYIKEDYLHATKPYAKAEQFGDNEFITGDDGRAYVDKLKRETIHWRVPLYISISALIVSIISIITQILKQ